jgi:phosphotransferase system  glucose/maltose/N-acetylglucosamine-specific IIC component
VLFFAHWRLWRSRAARVQAQLSLAAGALLLAAFISVEAARLSGGVTWISAVVGALTFSTAIGLNFIPGALRRRQTSK